MNIRQLIIFKTVCEEESVTKAAGRLFMTQPAVSHVIAELEREAGTPLFERRSRRIHLNQRGRLLLEKTIRLLELYGDIEEDLSGLEDKAGLRIGSSITIAGFWLPGVLREFEQNDPGIPVFVRVDTARNTAGLLQEGAVDMALIEGGAYMERFDGFAFSAYEIVPLCAPGYLERMGGRMLSLKKFAAQKLLLREEGSAIRDVVDGVFLQHQLAVRPHWVSVNSQALLMAAREGLGIAVLPEILAQRELQSGALCRLEIEGVRFQNENHLVYCRGSYLTEPMRRLIGIMERYRQNT